jgi:eukaryotic-like serine/threonine-protein kinase
MTQSLEALQVSLSPLQGPSFSPAPPQALTLRQQLEKRVFDPPKKLWIFSRLVEIVSFLHQQGVVHRRLSPDAIYYVDASQTLWVSDFAQAIHLGDERAGRLTPSAYSAPEQCSVGSDSGLFDPRADLFSLGAILYELLTGQAPFTGSGPALFLALLEREPTPPSELVRECSPRWEELCLWLLSKDKSERPASVASVQEALREILSAPEANPASDQDGSRPLLPEVEEPTLAPSMGAARVNPLTPAHPLATLAPEARYQRIDAGSDGALGRISRVYDKRLSRLVAIKESLRRAGGDLEERFLQEALIIARLEHPSIVPIYEVGRWESGEPFYTMKLVEGRTLDQLIDERRLFEDRLALLPHVIAACEAIAFAHARQIMHRDLKPQSILVGAFGETMVIDWGIAKELHPTKKEAPAQGAPLEQGLTNAGTAIRAPAYLPIEQVNGTLVDARADVYSLGAILYQVLCGQPPYDRRRSLEVLAALVDGPPVPIQEKQGGAPKELAAIVNKAMSRQAKERYPSAKELVEELKRFTTGQLVGAHQYTSGELLRRWFQKNRLLVSAGLTLAATVVAAVIMDDIRVRDQQALTEKKRRESYEQRELLQMQNDRLSIESEKQKKSLEELKLSQAISWLDVDPLMSLSWLHELDREYPNQPWNLVRLVAFAAELRGVPTAVLGASWSTPACVSQSPSNAIVFSSDGSLLLSGEEDGSLRVWTVKTSACRKWKGHSSAISSIVLSPDGNHLVSMHQDGTVLLWDTVTWKSEAIGRSSGGLSITFSTDSRLLAWSVLSGVLLWDLESRAELGRLVITEDQLSQHFVSSLAFQPNGALLAVMRVDGVVQLWNVLTQKKQYQTLKEGSSLALATRLFFSADGRRLFFFWANLPQIFMLEVSNKNLQRLEKSLPTNAALSPDDRWLVVSDVDGRVWLWDLKESPREQPLLLKSDPSQVTSLRFSMDGRSFLSSGEDGTVRVFSLQGEPIWTLRGHSSEVQLAVSPQGGLIASAARDGSLRLWETSSVARLSGHEGVIWDFSFSLDGRELLTLSKDASVKVWDTSSTLLRELSTPQAGGIVSAALSPGGYWVAAANKDNSLSLRSVDGKGVKLLHTFTQSPSGVAFSADGDSLWVSSMEGTLTQWEIPSGRLLVTIQAPDHLEDKPLSGLVLFAGDKKALTMSSRGRLRLWDLEQQTPIASLFLQTNMNTSQIAVSPDGKHALVSGDSSKIIVWGLESNLSEELLANRGGVEGIAFLSDDTFLSVGAEGALQVWDVTTKKSVSIPLGIRAYHVAVDRHLTQLAYATVINGTYGGWLRRIRLRTSAELERWLQSKRLPPGKAL